MTRSEVEAFLKENAATTVMAGGVDQYGNLRGKRMPPSYFLSILDRGLRFAWFLVNTGTVDTPVDGILDSGVPDIVGRFDLPTLRMLPWEPGTAFVFMNWHDQTGAPSPLCPRTLLRTQTARLAGQGLEAIFALELEFFLLATPIEQIRRGGWSTIRRFTEDKHCYVLYEGSFYEPVVSKIRDYFSEVLEGCTPEWGEGQFEANLRKTDALTMADTAALFKMAVKQEAAKAGLSASFMAKIFSGYSGNSGHLHHSLRDTTTGRNVCWDDAEPLCMAKAFNSYIAGNLEMIRDMTLLLAPFINSYKRFQLDSFAGVTKTWAVDNRTVGFRFINVDQASCRIENRFGGADLNPYTAFAATIACGLWGQEQGLTLPPQSEGNSYHIPGVETVPLNLWEAVEVTDRSERLKSLLGHTFVDNIIAITRQEIRDFNAQVTDLELRRYFEMA